MFNIREGRMGPPKTFKTGAVVRTYPKPMLVLEGDVGGLDIVKDPVIWLDEPGGPTLSDAVKLPRESQPPISAFFFREPTEISIAETYGVRVDNKSFPKFATAANKILNCKLNPFPWKTVVLDPITALGEVVLGHFAGGNADKMADARKWASLVGLKQWQIIGSLTNLPCHVVFIFHTKIYRDELTSTINAEPIMYATYRDLVGGLLSQFFYQDVTKLGPKVYTQPFDLVKGIGMRWPSDLKPIIDTGFKDIYGESVKKGETWE